MASNTLFKNKVTEKTFSGDTIQFIEGHPILDHFHWANSLPIYKNAIINTKYTHIPKYFQIKAYLCYFIH